MATIGRPPGTGNFTQEIADTICERLAAGTSLRRICAEDNTLPRMATIFRWLADERYAAFREQYTRARESMADVWFEEIVDIADDSSRDMVERPDGSKALDSEHVQRSKLRVDARKWAASKLAPKKYGDRLDTTVGNPDGSPIVTDDPRRIAMAVAAVFRAAQTQSDE